MNIQFTHQSFDADTGREVNLKRQKQTNEHVRPVL